MQLMKKLLGILFFATIVLVAFSNQSVFSNPDVCNCKGYKGIGGPCYAGKGGPAYKGKGGPCYAGEGGDGKNCPLVCKCKRK
jgi:hypothetical protein